MPKKAPPKMGGMVGRAQDNLGGRRAQLDAAIDAQTGYKPKPAMKSTPVPPRAPPRKNTRAPRYK